MLEFQVGQIVKSKAGRDKDHYFIIIEDLGEYVYLVDGHLRKLEKPKKKKKKHLQTINVIVNDLKEQIIEGYKITNADIRKALELYVDDLLEVN
ncbi:KOW domain-containing RNA-binding protein [Vallitalea okinawensis]|uniref:KOW domain-containing RNA-binding protein n=1 Tax=Vallitalea okinawensis TaxID=2078660 RepID=UPI000CFBEBD4|nr:KOW domain-containing RNA-binding protein [Vallitalea okinawensis]